MLINYMYKEGLFLRKNGLKNFLKLIVIQFTDFTGWLSSKLSLIVVV